jgi:uncharacterized protein YdiU (UPF0061 family)
MSILGLTIDYGPYSFVDNYDPLFTPNTTDLPGRRYAFGKQASVAKWNLGCLAGAIAPLLPNTEELVKLLDTYDDVFWSAYYLMMANKTGLDAVRPEDISLFTNLEKMLQLVQPDLTIFYQLLIDLPLDINQQDAVVDHFKESFYNELSEAEAAALYNWIQAYVQRITSNESSREECMTRMRKTAPRFILRNYLLHQAIEDMEQGDDALFVKLQDAMKEPYSNKFDDFFKKRPSWAGQKAGCSMLSCSS